MSFFRKFIMIWCSLFVFLNLSALASTDVYNEGYSNQSLKNAAQLIIVRSDDWDSHKGTLHRFEKNNVGDWVQHGEKISIVVGKNGMAWGRGLHGQCGEKGEPIKAEGDSRAPAGIFSLGDAFGHTNSRYMSNLKMPYIEIAPSTEAVDDPGSKYYNRIVDTEQIEEIDWETSEKMGLISLYLKGIVVNHNTQNIDPVCGSQIFIHVWRSQDSGTAGCTAMKEKDMEEVLFWLDPSKNPLLVQLPKTIEKKYLEAWGLEELSL